MVFEATGPRRKFPRLRMGIPAQMETVVGRKKVRVIDISQGGAQLVFDDEQIRFDYGLLLWLRFEAFGTLVWRDGPQYGIEFDQKLSPHVLFESRREAPTVIEELNYSVHTAARRFVEGLDRL